ncbi:2-hydroxychromene-2-carboxylate isomerase [alpha proteobacterium U9-1i]|nr:2-hydroxychromene-2-carboxylate isomerase [alpha proteobacterium U9-1i]
MRRVTIDFFADISCPWCHVGWASLKQAAAQRQGQIGANVAWRGFLLAPDTPPEGVDRRAYLQRKFQPDQLAAAHKALTDAAEAAGVALNLEAPARIPNTIDAHRVIHWASEQGVAEPLIDALFSAYWIDGVDVSEHAALVQIAESVGMDPREIAAKLATNTDRDAIQEMYATALKIGVTGVPVAIFDRRIPVMGAQNADVYLRALDTAAA